MKVSELTGALLDYWVARAEGIKNTDIFWREGGDFWTWGHDYGYHPSTDWAQGGPLIEKHKMLCAPRHAGGWSAWASAGLVHKATNEADGETPLQAICRAVVRAKFGDEVPDAIR